MFFFLNSAYLKNLVKDKIKFIVFAHHRTMLDAITECLYKLNINFIRIDGSTKNEIRAVRVFKQVTHTVLLLKLYILI